MSDFIRIRLVLFDLDGTLVDSVPDLTQGVNAMLADSGLHPAGESEVRGWVGDGITQLVRRALASRGGAVSSDASLQRAVSRFRAAYADKLTDRSRAYPGACETLDALRERGLRLACVTNKDTDLARDLLAHLGLLERLDWAAGADRVGRGKPDPALLLQAMRACEAAPEHTLLVGDSRADVGAARAAGVPVVAVSYGYNRGDISRERPDHLIHHLSELPALTRRAA